MGVVMGTGYAGPGWEWPKAGHRQHLDHQVDVPHLKAKAKVVSGAIGRNFPYWDQTAEAPLWGAHSKPHPMGADIYKFRFLSQSFASSKFLRATLVRANPPSSGPAPVWAPNPYIMQKLV